MQEDAKETVAEMMARYHSMNEHLMAKYQSQAASEEQLTKLGKQLSKKLGRMLTYLATYAGVKPVQPIQVVLKALNQPESRAKWGEVARKLQNLYGMVLAND